MNVVDVKDKQPGAFFVRYRVTQSFKVLLPSGHTLKQLK